MSKKEGLLAGSPIKENQHQQDIKSPEFVNPSIKFFKQGVMLHKPVKGKGKGGAIGKRGTIGGWSQSSRRRMRELMLTHEAPAGWYTCGPSFTIPGPILPMEESKGLWKWFCREVERAGWGMIWRIEIQARGAHHWHCIMIQPVGHPADIMMLWMEALRTLPECDHQSKSGQWCRGLRTALPGAHQHAVHISGEGDRGAWMRYLQDHASKGKQEQIPENIGRHWGIVGKKHFVKRESLHLELTDREYARVVRWMRRLATPIRPNPSAPFGKSLSYSPRRGMYGQSVWYTDPITTARFAQHAKDLTQGDHDQYDADLHHLRTRDTERRQETPSDCE